MTTLSDLADGARNVLVECAEVKAGDKLLIVHENPALGWYDLEAPTAVATEARTMGVMVSVLEVGAPDNDRSKNAAEAIASHDCVIFFARIGDQDRFSDPAPGKTVVMCYVRDADMLASAYGRTHHRAFQELKEAVNLILLGAEWIKISCPLGTNISGSVAGSTDQAAADVSVRRFPLGVPLPVTASGFSGRVALARYLTPTGSKVYEPPVMDIETPVFAEVSSGRIEAIAGEPNTVARIREHYARVAGRFGIDANAVHSWHAGIHPGCAYTMEAAQDPDRWSNTVFTNPRVLHFHTCGAYAPGEICWMVLDHTVEVDGVALWSDGHLRVEAFEQTRRCLQEWPELTTLFAHPSDRIGLPA